MLETLRQFAREQLDEAHDTDARRRTLARHMSQVAHDAGHGVMGADDAVWLARIRADIDNIRAAIGWALDSDDADDQELALSILAPLSWISQNCSDLAFDLLATRAAPLAEDAEPSLRTPVLTLAGYHYWQQGDLEQARAFVERAIDAGIVTDLINPLDPYVMLVAIEMTAGNHVRAFEALEAARVHFDDTECKADVARALGGFATFEAMAGRIDAALADSERAMQLAQSSGNLQFLANVLNGRAWALQRDDPEGALEVAEEFVAIYRRVGVARSVAPGLFALVAGLRARLGDDEGAFLLLRDAVVIASGRWHVARGRGHARLRAHPVLSNRPSRGRGGAPRRPRSWRPGPGRQVPGCTRCPRANAQPHRCRAGRRADRGARRARRGDDLRRRDPLCPRRAR